MYHNNQAVKSNLIKSNQIKSNQIKSNLIKSNQVAREGPGAPYTGWGTLSREPNSTIFMLVIIFMYH